MNEPVSARPPSRRALITAGLVAMCMAGVVLAGGTLARMATTHSNAQWAAAQAIPTVQLARVTTVQAGTIELPGTAQPFQRAQIFARVNGYLHAWYADIGAHVRAGQPLALIDTPDLDQQLAQARGDLEVARANARLARLTSQRWSALQTTGAVAQQMVDEKAGDSDAKHALVDATTARLRGIEALVAYKRITSPFAGVVTARKTDIGALINAGSAGQELFEVADLSRLRIYVDVPQVLASTLKPGDAVGFTLPETPGVTHVAHVVAVSHMLDARTRTMLVQVQAPNPAGAIGAGAYCRVQFRGAGAGGGLQIPATALVMGDDGAHVAVLGAGNRVQIRKVTLGHDNGTTVAVTSGLAPGVRVIDNPPETLRDGDPVRVSGA